MNENNISMNPLQGMVLWQELKSVAKITDSYRRRKDVFKCKTLGNALFVEIASISDPILRTSAMLCDDLSPYYPLQQFLNNFCSSRQQEIREELKKEKKIVEIYNMFYVEINHELLQYTEKKGIVYNSIDLEIDDTDGYDRVYNITKSFAIGLWE